MVKSKVNTLGAKAGAKKGDQGVSNHSGMRNRSTPKTGQRSPAGTAQPNSAAAANGQHQLSPEAQSRIHAAQESLGLLRPKLVPTSPKRSRNWSASPRSRATSLTGTSTMRFPTMLSPPKTWTRSTSSCATSRSRLSTRPKWTASSSPKAEEEEEKGGRLDILDDPVRMYLKQMGQVPLLTREQEVEISKRIEEAENEVKRIIYSFGFAGKEHIALAEKLISEPPKERFDRVIVDKKIEGREDHLKALRQLVKNVRELDQDVDEKYADWQSAPSKAKRDKAAGRISKSSTRNCREPSPSFIYKQKVIEEMALVAENIHDKIQISLRSDPGVREASANPPQQQMHHPIRAAEDQGARRIRPHALPGIPQGLRAAEAFRATRRSRPKPKWWKPTCASSFPSPRNTPTAACPSST